MKHPANPSYTSDKMARIRLTARAFDMGNSPLEYTHYNVNQQENILTTINGISSFIKTN